MHGPNPESEQPVTQDLSRFTQSAEHEADARRFLREMEDRLAKFKLATEPAKTQILQFGVRDGVPRRRLDGPRTFDFLGFTLLVKKSRFGRPVLAMKTARARVQKKLRGHCQINFV